MTVKTLMPVAASAVLIGLISSSLHGQGTPPAFPGRLGDAIARYLKPTAAEKAKLLQGEPVTKFLDADPAVEVAIFGAVWVKAPDRAVRCGGEGHRAVREGGNFLVTKRISSPPRLEDFAQLTLPPDDIVDLKTCKVGSCEMKLGEPALTRIRGEVDWSKPDPTADVEALIRGLALEYVKGYLEGGNERLATYRDSSRPTFVSQEFSSMIERHAGADGVSAGAEGLPAALPEGHAAEERIILVLAEREVRIEADNSHQPPDDLRTARQRCRHVEDAVRQPLLLDGARAAGAGAGSGAWRRLLVREREPQPLGWLERIQRLADSRQGPRRSRKGFAGGAAQDKGQPREAVGAAGPVRSIGIIAGSSTLRRARRSVRRR